MAGARKLILATAFAFACRQRCGTRQPEDTQNHQAASSSYMLHAGPIACRL